MKCHNCGYETELFLYQGLKKEFQLCEICSKTYLFMETHFFGSDPLLCRSIAWIGNKILEEIRRKNENL